jgi:hypothetical protein
MIDCKISKVNLTVIDLFTLSSVFDKLTVQKNISFLVIETNQTLNSYSSDLEAFISVRPWWFILQLPFESLRGVVPQEMVFIRNPSFLEPSSRLLASINFPNKSSCQSNPLYATLVDGTW